MLEPEQVLHIRQGTPTEGHYRLKQKLGQTAGRQTWLAEDLAAQPLETVVIKLLAFGDQVQWDDLKLFEREAQVLRQLKHSQIPKYRDYFSIDDRLLWFGLVQDHISGASLKQLIAGGQHFSERQVRQMAANLLYLLIYLHELSPPVLHRDIKPSNLILGKDNYIYLIDFGAVQDKAAAEGSTFTVVGTYGYAPMEQFGGRAVAASDLYALGATLIHLLTGVSPAELPQKDLKIQFADRVSLDPDFVWWVAKLVQPDVAKRFQTARQALEALRSLEASKASPLSTSSQQPDPSRERSPALQRERSLVPHFDTRIQLHQTADELLIQVPGANPWNLLYLIPVGIGLAIFGQIWAPVMASMSWQFGNTLFFFLPIALLIAASTYWDFLPTYVQFTPEKFAIYKSPFGFSLTMIQGSNAEIHNIFHTLRAFRAGKQTYEKRVVTIQTYSSESFFAKGFSWDECNWLVKVIKEWLRMA
ncbi:serine/threonine protein kinase [Trichocoleus desertorum AS-A10]|uniref:serine/threonine protein kinase n=1 Tax=Trichocoleus desertorum TaxID=1481672 RepID=UPI003298CF5F